MKNKELSPKAFSEILVKKSVDTDFISKLKIAYRPYICPFEDILNQIESGKSVFDIGCGSGMFLNLCAEFCLPSKLGGIEISENLISNAKSLLEEYEIPLFLAVYNGIDFPKELKDYDVVTLIDVLHHVPSKNQDLFIKNILSNMKKGAILIVKDIDAGSPFVVFNKIHDFIFSKEIGVERKSKELKSLFENQGQKIVFSKYRRVLVYPHYFFTIEA